MESDIHSPMPSAEQAETFAFVSADNDFHAVECKMTTTDEINHTKNALQDSFEADRLNSSMKSETSSMTSGRKSVSIITPTHGKG